MHRSQPLWMGAGGCCRDREEFRQWADVLANRFGYNATFTGVGRAMNESEALLKLGMTGKDLGHASQVTRGCADSHCLASSGQLASTSATLGPAGTCGSSSAGTCGSSSDMASDSMAMPWSLQQNSCCKE